MDYKFRNEHHGNEIAPIEVAGFDPYTINLDEPVIYNKNDLKVTAFEVEHDPVPAVGFKFDYKGRSIVISGDTKYSQKVIDGAKNADVLFHENQANHILEMMNKYYKDILKDKGEGIICILYTSPSPRDG